MSERRGGVQARNYVLHLDASGTSLTLCGRPQRSVHRAGPAEQDRADDGICRACRKKRDRLDATGEKGGA